MSATARIVAVAGLAVAATALLAGPAVAAPGRGTAAVFVQSDNPQGNTVISYARSASGTLTQTGVFSTGGNGGILTGSVVDHQASQGALTLDHNHLYALNAGSNTLTVFDVHGDQLSARRTLTTGDFPVSVTTHGDLVYVLNARQGGSIQGYRWQHGKLAAIPGSTRGLGLDPAATPEFTHTPGQVAFTPDGNRLVVTTKAGANSIDVFAVANGRPTSKPVINSLPGAVPFAVTFDRHGHLVVAEAGSNSIATFTLRDGHLVAVDAAATGQAATCWVTAVGDTFYVSNAGSGSVSGYRNAGGKLSALGNTAAGAGSVDSAASSDGRFLYVQTGAAGAVAGFRVGPDGSLVSVGSVTVPGAVGGEGIAAS
jgi:6-phosphogluconolactonase (cycloisomerase 2 family)